MSLPALFPVGWREALCVCVCVCVHARVLMCACVYVTKIGKKRVHCSWWRNFPPAHIPVMLYHPLEIFHVEKYSNINRFYVSICMTCTNTVSLCKFISKCKTHNYGRPVFKKRLRYTHSPVVDKNETAPCNPLTGIFWRLSRKSYCSLEQSQHWEDCPRVEASCNHDRQSKSEKRKFYQVSCNKCFPYDFLGYI